MGERVGRRRERVVTATTARAGTPIGGSPGQCHAAQVDDDECAARFAAARIGRLATVRPDGAPHLVPVTTAVVAGSIVFAVDHKPKRTAALARLANIAAEPRVAFLADGYDEDWSALWWVRADGLAAVLDAGAHRDAALAALIAKYPQYKAVPPTGVVVSASVVRWRGWSAGGGRPGGQGADGHGPSTIGSPATGAG